MTEAPILRPICLIGPPASGKTTLADRIASEIKAPVLRPRDVIHKAVGQHPAIIDLFARDETGRVPDASLGLALRVALDDLVGTVILENLPWDAIQLADLFRVSGSGLVVLYLHASDELVTTRRTGRKHCAWCYPLTAPTQSEAACARCGAMMTARTDDEDAAFVERLGLNRTLTARILDLALKLRVAVINVEADRPPAVLATEALAALAEHRSCPQPDQTPWPMVAPSSRSN